MIQAARIHRLDDRPPARGRFVLYWMQQSQRAEFNPALEFAVEQANALRLPTLVGFALTATPATAGRSICDSISSISGGRFFTC